MIFKSSSSCQYFVSSNRDDPHSPIAYQAQGASPNPRYTKSLKPCIWDNSWCLMPVGVIVCPGSPLYHWVGHLCRFPVGLLKFDMHPRFIVNFLAVI